MLKNKLLKFLFHLVLVTKYFTFSEILANGVTVILANGVTVIALNNNRFSGHLQYKKLSKILPSYVLLLALKLFTRVNTKV